MLTFTINCASAAVGLLRLEPRVAMLAFQVEAFSPALAAVAVTALVDGGAGLGRLVQRCTRWRVGWRWYVIVLVGLPAFLAAAIGVALLLAGGAALTRTSVAVMTWAMLPVQAFVGGPLHEEIGWRGFALPRLLDHFGDLTASLVLGVLWSAWHWQPWDLPTLLQRGAVDVFVPNQIATVSLAIVMTWVYRNTGGSALLAGFGVHLAVNTVLGAVVTGIALTGPAAVTWGQAAGLTVLAMIIVARCGPRSFSRTRRSPAPTGNHGGGTGLGTESPSSLDTSTDHHVARPS